MTMIVAGLALTLTLDTHSQMESETPPHFVTIKTLFAALTTKQCNKVSGSTFQVLRSCFQLLIIAAKHSVYNETGFLDQFWHLSFVKVNNYFYSQFFFDFLIKGMKAFPT